MWITYRKFVSSERRNDFLPSLPVLEKLGLAAVCGGTFNLFLNYAFPQTLLSFWMFTFYFLKQWKAWELENRPLSIGRYFRKSLLGEQFVLSAGL